MSRHTSNDYMTCMKMPVHMFISLGNILSEQFRKEQEEQEKAQEEAESHAPRFDMPDYSSMLNNFNIR